MSASKSQTKSRLALLLALVALVAAAATQLAPRQNGARAATARAAQPSFASPAAPAPAAVSAPGSTGAAAPHAAAAPQGAGMRAYIDPATGQLRAPEQEELAAATALRTARLATQSSEAPDLDLEIPGGGVARLVDDSVTVYAIATIGPDGKPRFEHAQGGAAARTRVAAAGKSRGRATTEVGNER
jgi:hypothetical protein